MSRRTGRAPARNEVKMRLDDDEYCALLAWKKLNGYESEGGTAKRIMRLFLLGAVGTLPTPIEGVSDDLGHIGTRLAA